MYRFLPLFFLVTLAACAPEQNGPESLGEVVGATEIEATLGDKGVSFVQWQLLDDSRTTGISFRLMVPHDGEWVSDVYNYTQRPVDERPATSTIQQTVELCWVELLNGGDTISAGAVPDTDGTIAFRLAYGKEFAGAIINMRCDISKDAKPLTIGVAFEETTIYGPFTHGKGFKWYGTYPDTEYPGIRTTVTIR